MHWLILLAAAALEITWALGLKFTQGFTRLWPTSLVIVAAIGSVALLAAAARGLPIGTAYAVWTGIGAAGTAIGGMVLFHESASPARLVCIGLIIVGVAGLRAFTH